MTELQAPHPSSDWTPRKAARDTSDVWLGGVAAGLARHLGAPVLAVRGGFVLLAAIGGFGIVLYAAFWLVLPTDAGFADETPGIGSATRTGKRPRGPRTLAEVGPIAALAAIGLGLVLLTELTFGQGVLFWPIVLGLGGIAVLWRQADQAQRERWLDTSIRLNPVQALVGTGGRAAWLRLGSGVALIVAAVVVFVLSSGNLSNLRQVLLAAGLVFAGLAVTIGPWIVRLVSDLGEERAQRVRTQERADLAAHLHDSVLQTLALIQKNASDPAMVSRLARGQERDLRSWLFDEPSAGSTLAEGLKAAAAAVEDAYDVTVDVITVGEVPLTPALRPLLDAATEALTNAAKHAGVPRIDVYAERSATQLEIFVRDRGVGFDPDRVAEDRQGVRGSIMDRMARHGGTARVRSEPGVGTEVWLTMPIETETEEGS